MPKDTADLTVFFAHLGSMCLKAVRGTLMKLSPLVELKNRFVGEIEVERESIYARIFFV